jgi:hypothetical protein
MVTLMLMLRAAAPRAQPLLDDLRWEQRVLLVFAADPASEGVGAQRLELAEHGSSAAGRDLVLLEVFTDSVLLDGERSEASAAELRSRFGLTTEDVAFVLVGKDGGEKLRSQAPIPACRLFERIDAMPMRRRELASRAEGPVRCPPD